MISGDDVDESVENEEEDDDAKMSKNTFIISDTDINLDILISDTKMGTFLLVFGKCSFVQLTPRGVEHSQQCSISVSLFQCVFVVNGCMHSTRRPLLLLSICYNALYSIKHALKLENWTRTNFVIKSIASNGTRLKSE